MVKTMKNKDKYDLNTLKIEWSPQTFEKRLFTVKVKRDESIIFSKEMKPNETGSNAYNAWLEQEYKLPILEDAQVNTYQLFILEDRLNWVNRSIAGRLNRGNINDR